MNLASRTFPGPSLRQEKVYGLAHYHGVPESLMSKLREEPLMPDFALTAFDYALGPLLILLGIMTLVGFFTRISLFTMGLIYSGLTVGLILLKQDSGIAWLGTHLALVALALVFADRNRFYLCKRFSHL
jgi:thiosulfate dehydrogenase [quinone] large subunit